MKHIKRKCWPCAYCREHRFLACMAREHERRRRRRLRHREVEGVSCLMNTKERQTIKCIHTGLECVCVYVCMCWFECLFSCVEVADEVNIGVENMLTFWLGSSFYYCRRTCTWRLMYEYFGTGTGECVLEVNTYLLDDLSTLLWRRIDDRSANQFKRHTRLFVFG